MNLKEQFREKLLGHLSDHNTELDIQNACKIAEKYALAFYSFMRAEDTQENAEKYFGYSDRDMLNEFNDKYK